MLYNGFQLATPRLGSRNFVVSKVLIKLDLKPAIRRLNNTSCENGSFLARADHDLPEPIGFGKI